MSDAITFAVEVIASNRFLERLALASVEVTILGAAVWLLARCRAICSPRLVAWCWLLVVSKGIASLAVGPVVSIGEPGMGGFGNDQPPAPKYESFHESPEPSGRSQPSTYDFAANRQTTNTGQFLTGNPMAVSETIVILWCGGVVLLVTATLRDLLRTRRIATEPAPQSVQDTAHMVARAVGMTRTPRVWLTDALESPAVLGYVRPKIVLPRWVVSGDEGDLQWALEHEMAHVRHFDHAANAIRRLAAVLFFFHPVVWIAGRYWEENAEFACDAALAKSAQQARDSARRLYNILVRLQHHRGAAACSGLYASRTQVGRRIEALLRFDKSHRAQSGKWNVVAGTVATALAVFVLMVGFGGFSEPDLQLIGGRQVHVHTFNTEIEERFVIYQWNIFALGRIGFSQDHESITSMSGDARLVCNVTGLRSDQTIIVAPGANGTPTIEYRVNGDVRDLDSRAQTWLRRAFRRLDAVRGSAS